MICFVDGTTNHLLIPVILCHLAVSTVNAWFWQRIVKVKVMRMDTHSLVCIKSMFHFTAIIHM